jgi:hypothetical protein
VEPPPEPETAGLGQRLRSLWSACLCGSRADAHRQRGAPEAQLLRDSPSHPTGATLRVGSVPGPVDLRHLHGSALSDAPPLVLSGDGPVAPDGAGGERVSAPREPAAHVEGRAALRVLRGAGRDVAGLRTAGWTLALCSAPSGHANASRRRQQPHGTARRDCALPPCAGVGALFAGRHATLTNGDELRADLCVAVPLGREVRPSRPRTRLGDARATSSPLAARPRAQLYVKHTLCGSRGACVLLAT